MPCGRSAQWGALMDWARILAYITGTVDQELLLRNEYLAVENRILKGKLNGRLRLSNAERAKLGEIAHRLGSKALGEVANVARPRTRVVRTEHSDDVAPEKNQELTPPHGRSEGHAISQ